jgi:hypothetical protein
VDCDGDAAPDIAAGEPLVCLMPSDRSGQATVLANAIVNLVRSLPNRGSVEFSVGPAGSGAPAARLDRASFPVEFTRSLERSVAVTYTCPAADEPATYGYDVGATAQGAPLAAVTTTVSCVPPDAPAGEVPPVLKAAPPLVGAALAPAPQPPSGQGLANPNLNPNPNPNPQAQPNPGAVAEDERGAAAGRRRGRTERRRRARDDRHRGLVRRRGRAVRRRVGRVAAADPGGRGAGALTPYARRVRRALPLLLLAAACARGGGSEPSGLPAPPAGGFDPPVTVTFEGAPPIRAEVARTTEQRARGLMQRTEVPEGTGMVFLFAEPSRGGFWMKGTLVPLSIAYVNGDRVVSTAEMTPCRADPCPTYDPTGPYTMAVEAPGGFFPKHGVGPGTRVRVDGPTTPPAD